MCAFRVVVKTQKLETGVVRLGGWTGVVRARVGQE